MKTKQTFYRQYTRSWSKSYRYTWIGSFTWLKSISWEYPNYWPVSWDMFNTKALSWAMSKMHRKQW